MLVPSGSHRSLSAWMVVAVIGITALFGRTAHAGSYDDFMDALRHNRVEVLRQLQPRGFDLNSPSPQLDPPLVLAIRHEAWKVAHFLSVQPEVNVEALNPHGENALMLAALKGRLDLLEVLLQQRHAEPNQPGWTALHYAATHASPVAADMVRLLLEHHAYIDAASPNGTTPLMMAAQYGHPSVVKVLLEAGADPTLRNHKNLSAEDFARTSNRMDLLGLIQSFRLGWRQSAPDSPADTNIHVEPGAAAEAE